MWWYYPDTNTPLAWILEFLADIVSWCRENEESWRDVWMIGEYVGTALLRVASLVESIRWKLFYLSMALERAWEFIRDFCERDLLSDRINELWDGWAELIAHPGWYIIDRIFAYSPDFYWLIQDPVYFIEFWFTEKWPWLAAIIENPGLWAFEKVAEFWPDFYWLYQDPGYMVASWLTERFPGLGEFLSDPDAWLKARMPDPLEAFRSWIISNMLHVLQAVIETTWEGGEAD